MGENSGFKGMIVAASIIGLIAVLAITFSLSFVAENDKSTDIIETEELDYSLLNDTIASMQGSAEGWKDVFTAKNPFDLIVGIVSNSFWSVLNLMWTSIITYTTIFGGIFVNVLKVPVVFIGGIATIILIYILFYIWRVLKRGD